MTTDHVVVAGTDGSAAADTAIKWAADEALSRHASLRLVHVFVWPEFEVPLGRTDLAPGLAADARLIVLGSRGRGGFAGMMLGSVSQTVLHHSLCPVAVIPAATPGG